MHAYQLISCIPMTRYGIELVYLIVAHLQVFSEGCVQGLFECPAFSQYPRLTRPLVAGGDCAQAGQLHLLRVAARAARGAARHRLPHRRGELLLGGVQGAQVQGRLPHSVQVK